MENKLIDDCMKLGFGMMRLPRVEGTIATPHSDQRLEKVLWAVLGAYFFWMRQKEGKSIQSELAERTQTTKSYISKIGNGVITPSVGVFYRIIAALGMRVEVVKPVY